MMRSTNVLVVDDDELMCELLQAQLEERGFRVSVAHNLEQLRSRIREQTYQFVLLDLFLGEDNGLEALPFLVREAPYTKVLVMSANGTVELAVDAMEKGASSFLCKTKDPKDLIHALEERLEAADMGLTARTAEGELIAHGIIGRSAGMASVLENIDRFKNVDSTVLIQGESGTGKELVARAIHNASERRKGPFQAVNCGAIPENLLESELFGHRKGSFTGATSDRKGLFEVCSRGTLFLDEIGEMPLNLQVKLLRVLQEKEVMPLGSRTTIPVETRVIAATNQRLKHLVERGQFREDLYYRLAVLTVELPSLRERREDIPLLIEHFVKRFSERFNKQVSPPDKELENRLLAYDWPGNVRELQNAIERAVVLTDDGRLHLSDMLPGMEEPHDHGRADGSGSQMGEYWLQPLSQAKKGFEKQYLQHLLEVTRGNISEMARISGRYRADVYRLLTKYGVDWEEFRP